MVGASTPRAFMAASMDSASETADRAVDLAKAGASGWAKVCMRIGDGGGEFFFFFFAVHSARAGAAISHKTPHFEKKGVARSPSPGLLGVCRGAGTRVLVGAIPPFPPPLPTGRPPCAQFLSPHPFLFSRTSTPAATRATAAFQGAGRAALGAAGRAAGAAGRGVAEARMMVDMAASERTSRKKRGTARARKRACEKPAWLRLTATRPGRHTRAACRRPRVHAQSLL